MKKINVNPIQADIRKLLPFATLDKNIEHEYGLYMQSPIRELYGRYLKECYRLYRHRIFRSKAL